MTEWCMDRKGRRLGGTGIAQNYVQRYNWFGANTIIKIVYQQTT